MKRAGICSSIALLLFIMITSGAGAGQKEDLSGKIFYTTANIWYEHADDIPSTNFHKGSLIPVGTKVTNVEVGNGMEWQSQFNSGAQSSSFLSQGQEGFSRDMVRFYDERKKKYVIYFVKKHMGPNMTVTDLFHQYFSEEDPLRPGGPFQKLSQHEKELIKTGEIDLGMSKAAVLMAYGYPPGRQTASISEDVWFYWISRREKAKVYFLNDKVIKIR